MSALAAGIAATAATVGGLLDSWSGKQQYKYQRKLNEQQQQYARENAQMEYQNTRQLTEDAALLNKTGLQKAGYSVADLDKGSTSVAKAPSIASPNAGNAPLVDYSDNAQLLGQTLSQISTSDLQREQARKTKAETVNQLVENEYQRHRLSQELAIRDKQIEKFGLENTAQEWSNYLNKKFGESRVASETSSAESQAKIDKVQSDYVERVNEADLNLKLQTYKNLITENDNMIKSGKLTDEEIKYKKKENANYQRYIDSVISKNESSSEKDWTDIANVEEDTTGKRMNNALFAKTFDSRVGLVNSQAYKSLLDNMPVSLQEKMRDTMARIQSGAHVSFEERHQLVTQLEWFRKNEYDSKNTRLHADQFRALNEAKEFLTQWE